MRVELLYGVTYKIHIDRSELPPKCTDKKLLRTLLARLDQEYDLHPAETDIAVERYDTDSGILLLLSKDRPPRRHDSRYACDLEARGDLGALCRALSEGERPADDLRVYVSDRPYASRILLTNPSERTLCLCCEFGELTEITPLFAAQTAEQMSEAADITQLARLGEIL